MLLDADGNALLNEDTLPKVRALTTTELTGLVSAVVRFLTLVHGPEAAQLIAAYAIELEKEFTNEPDDGYVPPAATDENYEASLEVDE